MMEHAMEIEYECAFPFDDDTVEAILAAEDQIVFALNQEGELHECPEMGVKGRADNFITDYECPKTVDYEGVPRMPYDQHVQAYIKHVLDRMASRIALAINASSAPRPGEYVPSVNAHPDPDYHADA